MSGRTYACLIALSLSTACGGGGRDATPPPAQVPTAIATTAPAPGPGEWAKWSHEQKLDYMKSTVLPAEKQLWAAFNPGLYADMSCRTCHGAGAADQSYKMPSPDLPKLVVSPEGLHSLGKDDPKVVEFMRKEVAPRTASLLGEPLFDMKTRTGFGCLRCHTIAAAPLR